MKKDGKMLLLSQSSPTSQKMDGLSGISDKDRQMTNQNMENDFSVNVSIRSAPKLFAIRSNIFLSKCC